MTRLEIAAREPRQFLGEHGHELPQGTGLFSADGKPSSSYLEMERFATKQAQLFRRADDNPQLAKDRPQRTRRARSSWESAGEFA
jgi:hypothetical protein